MDESAVKVKTEKVDPEIEDRIQKHLLTEIKKEPEDIESSDEDNGNGSDSSTSESNAEKEVAVDDKKNIELQKSSKELLTELFQVFHVAPPDELFNDEDLLNKARHKSKKAKKDKRKKHKKHKKGVGKEESNNETFSQDLKKEKHKKKKKHKSKHEEKQSRRSKDHKKDKVKPEKLTSTSKEKNQEHEKISGKIPADVIEKLHSNERDEKESNGDFKGSRKRQASENIASERPAKIMFSIEKRSRNEFYKSHDSEQGKASREEHNSENSNRDKESKQPIVRGGDLKREHSTERFEKDWNSRKDRDLQIKLETNHKSREIISSQRSQRNNDDRNDLSDFSLSDEETYLRERGRQTVERHQDFSYRYRRKRSDFDRHRRRSRSRSRSRDLGIDKKRLLEIARKNAISMFKRGNLPGCANMSEDIKDKVLLQMRYGGRTVQDLTDFCRKISNGEPLPELSSDNDSDVDKNGNVKPFHHPFQVKDRDPIVLQLRNPIPIPVSARKEDLTKAITMQFPVSSGQEHRRTESWIPVESNSMSVPLPALPVAKQSTNIFKQAVPKEKNIFAKALPAAAEQQKPAFKPVNALCAEADSTSITATNELSTNAVATPTATLSITSNSPTKTINERVDVTSTFVADVPIPSSTTNDSVFPESNSANVDVSSIISKRLGALRRLQENPMDSEAIKIIYNAQKEMSTWASSKQIPGQFTGSTGANVLRAHELNAGPQVWARRDQLTSTKPMTGGMGMHLLQKMGWKPGEGLGREKKGALQPLLLDVKLDKRGLVAKDDTGTNVNKPPGNKKRPNTAQEVMQSFQNKHPVCILNELTSKRKWVPPLYALVTENGPSHNKKFLFSVSINGQVYVPPDGSNTKKEAKMLAAKYCLVQIGILPN